MSKSGETMGRVNHDQSTTDSTTGTVDKIRDLLFGQQMDSYDQNFQRLEAMIIREARHSMDEMNVRLKAIETSVAQQNNENQQRFEHEQEERIQGFRKINNLMNENFKLLNNQVQSLETASNKDIAEIKISIDQHRQVIDAQLQTLQEQFNQSLIEQAARLDTQSIKREKMAGLLSELAAQFKS